MSYKPANASSEDYYHLLDVSRTATSHEIEKSFREKSVEYDTKETADMFKQLKEAFKCLKDDEKRRLYDRYGREDLATNISGDLLKEFFGEKGADIEVVVTYTDIYGTKREASRVLKGGMETVVTKVDDRITSRKVNGSSKLKPLELYNRSLQSSYAASKSKK